MGKIFNSRNQSVTQSVSIDSITLGTVISNSDPHQMGRLKILCPVLGDDTNDLDGANLPWAAKVSNLGGMTNSSMKRGPNEGSSSAGPIAYGFWGVPKVGSTVVVCCLDGDPYYRLWLGSIFDQGSTNTLPHGRYFYQGGNGEPNGPLDSFEQPIEPLYSNQQKAFTSKSGNYEWRTRGADYSATGNVGEFSSLSPSKHPDETTKTAFTSADGKSYDIQNGYAASRVGGREKEDESSVYSWTSPGFHSISMDDRPENCRVRIRTTCGAQILFDDTNERMYLSTPQGENWIEMDYNGNVDIYARMLSVRTEKDMNFTAGESMRFHAKSGIHMYTPDAINMQAQTGISMYSQQDVNIKANAGMKLEAVAAMNLKAGAALNAGGGAAVNVKAGAGLNLTAGGAANLRAGGNIVQTGAMIHLNGPGAATAASPEASAPEKAKWTSRLPTHEPFTRTMTKDDYTHDPELQYDDPNVGKVERGVEIPRGKLWRR